MYDKLTFTCLLDDEFGVAESPVYDDRRNCLFFVDIPGKALYRVGLDGSGPILWTFDSEVCSIGLTRSGLLIAALRDTVILFDPDAGKACRIVASIEAERIDTRLNDGKVGPDGAFWVGTMHEVADRRPVASLYRVTPTGAVERKVDGIICSNGLAWTAEGSLLFHSDSRAQWIDRWRFDAATGLLFDRRRIATPDEATGRPDGAAIDSEGFYWSAGVSAGVLNRFSPDGEIVERHPFPVGAPTMPCFAGPGLRTMIVTSLRPAGAPAGSLASGIFVAQSPVAGAAVHRFDDSALV
ncbi:SMP-30/gluconolactonase/LRE family protein [Pararhizobium sp. A13]|uniref:SMP-30/gluconolactonase/LRE family protein n=1 Tax=Pararhizobium sp. A13 TaxID=3133975 RepID=UPI00311ADC31